MEKETKFTYPDYKAIREESHNIDCVLDEADFYTSHPNPYRIDRTASEINRCLKYKCKLNETNWEGVDLI